MPARFVDPTGTDSAKIATSRVGSTSATMVISRLAPIPPNAVPVSSPASASATVPSSQHRDHREQVAGAGQGGDRASRTGTADGRDQAGGHQHQRGQAGTPAGAARR